MDSLRTVSASMSTGRAVSVLRGNREAVDLYNGDLSIKKEPLSRTVRIYISSELSDSIMEKKHLHIHLYPRLRQFCQSLGLQLVIVDLYTAIPSILPLPSPLNSDGSPLTSKGWYDNVAYELETQGFFELSKREIKLCQQLSLGPTFVSLLAQRYGHKCLHQTIPETDFKLLVAAIDDSSMRKLVMQWYRLDTNALPVEYVLQSHRGMSFEEWKSIHQALSQTTRKAAKVALGKDISKAQRYTMSAIEEEATRGIFSMRKDPNNSCLWLKRTFTDLLEQKPTSDQALGSYADLVEGRRVLEFDQETMKALNHLKEAKMPAKYVGLESTNIFEYSLKWQKHKGLDPEGNTTHSEYLFELTEQLLTALESMVTNGLTKLLETSDQVAEEILSHASYCKKHSVQFMDRPAVTSNIFDYLQGSSNKPCVVYGRVGSGKTSIMAGVARMLRINASFKKATMLLRFIRATSCAQNIRHLLLGICKQICVVYKQELDKLPADYRSICKYLQYLLKLPSREKPLIILIDGVDELSPEDGALGMSWLPLHLSPYVKIVLSTSSEVRYSCFPVLQSLLANHQGNFIEVSELNASESNQLLRHSLEARGRTLTVAQERSVTEAFLQCRNPLYLQLMLREVTHSHSYLWNSSWAPAKDLDGITKQFFNELESKLGRVFIRSALGYITASKDGLTEMELLDILSSDDEVMQEVSQKWKPLYSSTNNETLLTSIPPLLISRFFHTLIPLLDYQMGIGGVWVLRWSHRYLYEAAGRVFLSYPPTVQAYYNVLANYFGGSLYQRSTDDSDERMCFEQPVVINTELELYNIRKVTLLPHFLAMAKRDYELQRLLMDYQWLKASISCTSCLDLVAQFAAVLPRVPIARTGSSDRMYELMLLRDALSWSVDALNCDQQSLASQLLGRLLPYINASAIHKWPNLKHIVLRALEDHSPIISPLHSHVNLPGGPLLVTMEGHRGLVTSIASTIVRHTKDDSLEMIIITSSEDKSLKTWDIENTGVVKTFDGHADEVLSVALTANGRYAASGSADRTARHWLVSTAECLCVLRGHLGSVSTVALTEDGQKTASASSDRTIKVWNTDCQSKTYGQIIFTVKEQKSPIISLSLFESLWLASLTSSGSVCLTNTVSGEMKIVAGEEQSFGRVTAITTARVDWFKQLVCGTDTGLVVLRDLDHLDSHRVLEPPSRAVVLAVAVGPKVVASYEHKQLIVWDLLSGSYLYSLTSYEGISHSCTLGDIGDLLITGGDDWRVRIWDLRRPFNGNKVTQHRGEVRSVVVSPCGNFGISAGNDSKVILYELATMKVLKELCGHSEAVTDIYALRDGRSFLTSSRDYSIKLWDGELGETVKVFDSDEPVNCIALDLETELLVSGGDNGRLTFWSLQSRERLKALTNHNSPVVFVAFAKRADFHYIISAARNGEVCIRNFLTSKTVHQLSLLMAELTCAAVSPNATLLALGSEDSTCCIVSIRNSARVGTLTGHRGAVTAVCVLPTNRECLTGSLDKTIRLFDIQTSDCLATFQTDLPITCLSTDSKGEVIIYGTREGWVSTAYNQTSSSGLSPVVKAVRGLATLSVSSMATTAEESRSSFVSETEPRTATTSEDVKGHRTSEVTEGQLPTGSELVNNGAIHVDSNQPIESLDYPLDVVVEVVNGNRIDSLSLSENIDQIKWRKASILEEEVAPTETLNSFDNEQPKTESHTETTSSSLQRLTAEQNGYSSHEQEQIASHTDTVKSSACLLF